MATIAFTIANPTLASGDRGDGTQLAAQAFINNITLTDAQQGVGLNAGMVLYRSSGTTADRKKAAQLLTPFFNLIP
jgi:hypothetical protein